MQYRLIVASILLIVSYSLSAAIEEGNAQQGANSDPLTYASQSTMCATCHILNADGTHGYVDKKMPIDPLAFSVNIKNVKNPNYIKRRFAQDCRKVLDRQCNSGELQDFLQYIRSHFKKDVKLKGNLANRSAWFIDCDAPRKVSSKPTREAPDTDLCEAASNADKAN